MVAHCSKIIEDQASELDLVYEQLWLTQQILKARAEEIKAAYERIRELEADLAECSDYLEDHSDVVDGINGQPEPNRAMRIIVMIDSSLHGEGNF